jgi:hypothetical protein
MSKTIFESKTIVANLIAVTVAVWQYFNGPILPADPQYFALAIAVINIGLRFKTSVPVTL